MHLGIGFSRRIAAHWPKRGVRIRAYRKFALKKFFHAALVHHQEHHVGLGTADLKSHAAAFHANSGRRRPTPAGPAAEHESLAILGAHNESGLLYSGHHYQAFGLAEQVLRNSFIRRGHDFGHRVGCRIQPLASVRGAEQQTGTQSEKRKLGYFHFVSSSR